MAATSIGSFVGILGPILGAGVAAYLGVRLGFARYTREKAFDTRMAWYENAVREIVEFAGALQVISGCAKRGASQELLDQYTDQLAARIESMNAVLALAIVYAKPSAIEAVTLLSSANSKLIRPIAVDPNDKSKGARFDLDGLERARLFAAQVAMELASELRQHVGREAFEPKVRWWHKLLRRRPSGTRIQPEGWTTFFAKHSQSTRQ